NSRDQRTVDHDQRSLIAVANRTGDSLGDLLSARPLLGGQRHLSVRVREAKHRGAPTHRHSHEGHGTGLALLAVAELMHDPARRRDERITSRSRKELVAERRSTYPVHCPFLVVRSGWA